MTTVGLKSAINTPYINVLYSNNPDLSPFIPNNVTLITPQNTDFVSYSEDSQTVNNLNTKRFRITRDYNFLGDLWLEFDLAVLGGDANGVNGTTKKRLINYWPLFMFQEIVIKNERINQRDIRINCDSLYTQMLETMGRFDDELEFQVGSRYLFGELTDAERDANALVTHNVSIPLEKYLFWSRHNKKDLPLGILEQDLVIDFKLKPDFLTYIAEYDGTTALNTSPFSNWNLRAEVFVTPEIVPQRFLQLASSKLVSFYRDYQSRREYWDATTTVWKIDLEPFVMDTAAFFVYMRYEDEVEVLDNNKGMDNLLPWSDYTITSLGKTIQERIYYNETVDRLNLKNLAWPRLINVLVHSNQNEKLVNREDPRGTKNYYGLTKPKLEITPDVDVIANLNANPGLRVVVDIIAAVANFISYEPAIMDGYVSIRKAFDA